MADIQSRKALAQLEPLGPDQYFIAFGPDGRQVCAAPTGYSASFLPPIVCEDIFSGKVRKITWATFGGEEDSFYFFYETKAGLPHYRAGKDSPISLQPFVAWATSGPPERATSLRVQLGHAGSWVAWAGSSWAASKIPRPLLVTLEKLSQPHDTTEIRYIGTLRSGEVSTVTWLRDGTFYVKAEEHWGHFETQIVRTAWEKLWYGGTDLSTLAHASFNPHSSNCDTFAFIRTAPPGKEADFVVHFEGEGMISRLGHTQPSVSPVHIPRAPAAHATYQWAVARHSGRGHPTDLWELELKTGEQLRVLQDRGNDWFVVVNMSGKRGWAHRSSLEFRRRCMDSREAYSLWSKAMNELLATGNARKFPKLSSYMDICTRVECTRVKGEPLGICTHDLMELLRGSGEYSIDFIKSQRNIWHPDKFARFCHPEHREELKVQAQALFVMFNVLID